MKQLFVLLLLTFMSPAGFTQEAIRFSLKEIGKPDYRKQYDADKGLVVYKNGTGSFVNVLAREYFVLGKFFDTLQLTLTKNTSAGYTAECTNCENVHFRQSEENGLTFYTFNVGEDFVRFIISYETKPDGMTIAPDYEGVKKNPEIGYVRMRNTLIHYAAVPSIPGVHLAIMDMNYNGRADKGDFLCLSPDAYFSGTASDRAKPIESVKTAEIKGRQYDFRLLNEKTFEVALIPSSAKTAPDLILKDELENLTFGDRNLYSALDTSNFVVISHWTEYSAPCTQALPDLNDLSETVPVIGLHTGNPDLPYIMERYSLNFFNVHSNDELKNKLNLNGYPNYFVVDKNKRIVLQSEDIEEVLLFLGQ